MSRLTADHAFSRFLAGFDLIISWFGDREGLWERNLKGASRGKVLVRPFRAVHAFPGHASNYYLTSLEELGLPEGSATREVRRPLLRFRNQGFPEARGGGEDPLGDRPFLCLHPGSGSESKNWPKENFLELARATLLSLQLPCTVLLGPAEKEQKAFWAASRGVSLQVMEGLSIVEVCGVLQRAALYVGNDSGITHLAAAVGAPVVALFGPGDPARWAPRGDPVEILRQPAPPERVLAALVRLHSSIIL
jgi:heptosyltransferase-3